MMRKLLTFLQAVAIATLIAGCGGTGTENEPEITPEIKFTEDIVTSGISVESAEQSITLSFSTNVHSLNQGYTGQGQDHLRGRELQSLPGRQLRHRQRR